MKDRSNMPKKRRLYPEKCMQDAIKAAQEGMSIRAAATKYNVPNSTLLDKLSGRSPVVSKIGRSTVLSESEEKMVVDWILKCRKRGMPPTKDDILNSIQDIIMTDQNRKTPFTNNRPGRSWLQLFMSRHPVLKKDTDITFKPKKSLAQKKLPPIDISNLSKSTITEEHIRSWFRQLREELTKMESLDVLDDPSRVFSSDELNIELCAKTGKVIGPKNWQNVYEMAPGPDKSTMTFLRTFCANGELVCPAVIYPFLRVPADISNCVPENFYVGSSESGWIKTETFRDFLAKGFINWLDSHDVKRPVILFVNGKTTHITVQLSEFCEENEIILYLLPNNTADILQPAKVGDFRPFKSLWKDAVTAFHAENPTSSLRRIDVAPLLAGVLSKIERDTIMNSFALSGLCPLDPDMVNFSKCTRRGAPKVETEDITQTYVPQVSRYASAKEVIMELLPKNRLNLVKKNQGEKGLLELWNTLNTKVDAEARSNEPPPQVLTPLKYDINDHVVISLDTNTISSSTEEDSTPQFTYVVLNQ